MKLWTKFKALFAKRRFEREMAEEMQAHIDELTDRNIASGMPPDEARYAAMRAFGGVEQIKERARDERGLLWLEQLGQDLRYGLRLMRKHWVYSLFVVGIMAVGIGVVTSVVSVVNALAIRKLPVHEPDRLILVSMLKRGFETHASYEFLRDNAQSVSAIMAVGYPVTRGVGVAGRENVESVLTEEVSGSFFNGLGVRAAYGRVLNQADDTSGSPGMVAVVSHDFWRDQLGGSEDAIGRVITLGDTALTVVGVMPAEFRGVRMGYATAIWLPLSLSPRIDGNQPWGVASGRGWLTLMARLRPGVTLSQAQAEFALLQKRAVESENAPARKSKLNPVPILVESGSRGVNYMWSSLRPQLLLLLGMTGAALVIACANVGSLILVRATVRNDEIATRMALGASRGRVMRQLVVESMMLIFVGSALGVVLAAHGAQALSVLLAGGIPVTSDLRVLAVTVALMLVFGGACSLIPAWIVTNRTVADGMRNRAGGSLRRRPKVLIHILVTAQIGLSFLLVSTAALLQQTLINLQSIDLGYDSHNLLVFTLRSDPGMKVPQQVDLYNRVLSRLRQHPGVEGATMSGSGLFSMIQLTLDYSIPDQPTPDLETAEAPKAKCIYAGPAFFATMGIPMIVGEGFDQGAATPILPEGKPNRRVVISQAFAQRHFARINPIGSHFKIGGADVEIIGVCEGIPFSDIRDKADTRVDVYLNYMEQPRGWRFPLMFELRSNWHDTSLPSDIRKIVAEESPTATISELMSMDERIEQLINRERSNAFISLFIGGFAILLAGFGLFGLLSHAAQMHTKEIGIRMALGANAGDVIWRVTRPGLIMAILGITVGLLGYLGVAEVLGSQLYMAAPLSFYVLGFALVTTVGVIVIACWLPARRAAKVDPMEALRCE